MGKIIKFFILIIAITTFSACENPIVGRNEIDDLEFIRALAIDKSLTVPNGVRLTVTTQRFKEGGEGSAQEKESTKVSAEGETAFEAIRNFSIFLDKKPFWGHLEYVIIGEDVAREGICQYLDVLSRDHEIRMNIDIFVMKGGRAEEMMEKTEKGDKFIFDRLRGLIESVGGQSVTSPVNLIEIMYIQDIKYLSLYLPCVQMIKSSRDENGKDETMDIKMAGFAVFDGDVLVGHLSAGMGRGLNWLRDNIKSGIIVVTSPKGTKVSLELIRSKTKFYPKIQDGKLFLDVKVEVNSNIGEVQAHEDVFKAEIFEYLERQQAKSVKREIEEVIEYAQKVLGLDFFAVGSNFYRKYPIKWENIYEQNWREEFPRVEINVDVKSQIRRTYDIKEPSEDKGDGKK
ncbi:MAG: Ger(x)C family spore germination protein [Clostridium sp.]|nr:Ger(x)C family spore germination protein [Clostridium sp.]